MKAIVNTEYGSPDVLRYEEVEKPVPKAGEVLVRVHASSINAGDWHLLRADPWMVRLMFGLTKPKISILGADIAGTVESVGEGITTFSVGDAVYGDISNAGFGAFAEYAVAPESMLAKKPDTLTFEEAATVPAASVTALQALRDHGKIAAGERVLINGASGGVGSFAVQLAKHFGAEVTGVCSTRNLERVHALGAEHVIDYTQEDFVASGAQYDLIHAANGNRSLFDYKRALLPKGRYIMSGGEMGQFYQIMLMGAIVSMMGSRKMSNMLVSPNGEDLAFVSGLIDGGEVVPVIDRVYPLAEVPDAIRYMEAGHVQGKIAISMGVAD